MIQEVVLSHVDAGDRNDVNIVDFM